MPNAQASEHSGFTSPWSLHHFKVITHSLNKLSALEKDTETMLLPEEEETLEITLLSCGHNGKAICKPGREVSPEISPNGMLILDS